MNPRYRILLGLFVGAIHMVFLLYLHFAYHELAESMFYELIPCSNLHFFVFFIAVSHAMNNEATVSMDLPLKPVVPLPSQSADIASQAKGDVSFILENK